MKKKITGIALILLVAFAFAACGRGGSMTGASDKRTDSAYEGYEASGAYEAEDSYGEEAYAEEAAAEEAGSGVGASGAYDNLDKIVYSCQVTMQTLEYDKTVDSIRKKTKEAGGILATERETDDDDRWYYDDVMIPDGSDPVGSASGNRRLYLTVRIPTDKYEAYVESLKDDGKILSKTQDADNISRTYNDTQAVIEMLETEEKRLQEMMGKAETIEDMISVESRLTEVQTELNQYRTHLSAMDTDLAYSTVTIEVEEVQRIDEPVRQQDTFGQQVRKIFMKAWQNFASFWKYLVYIVVYLIPLFVVIAVIIVIILIATRKQRAAAKARRRARKEDEAAQASQEAGSSENRG